MNMFTNVFYPSIAFCHKNSIFSWLIDCKFSSRQNQSIASERKWLRIL